jgi:hypothetical protein
MYIKKYGFVKFNDITLNVDKINGAFIGPDISGYANFNYY